MKILLKSKKGMSLLEVLIALAILSLLTIPIMTAFINTQIYAKKVDKQTEISAITRTVKQIVSDGMLNNSVGMIDKDGNIVNTFDAADPNADTFKSFIEYSKTHETVKPNETPFLQILEGIPPAANTKYTYKVGYKHSEFYNIKYPNVYNLVITIYDKGKSEVVNRIKIAVKI